MPRKQSIDEALREVSAKLPPKPDDSVPQKDKKAYSELLSHELALAFASILRSRGLDGVMPLSESDQKDTKGGERRMSGGIGAKRVDVTWSTEESGLLLALSIKTINFVDRRSKNYQKNLINRRGDMLMEAVTLHRRFPYAVLGGLFFLDIGAAHDNTAKRQSTFENAHPRLRLFTGRSDPSDRDEQYERLYLALFDSTNTREPFRFFEVGKSSVSVAAEQLIADLLQIVSERNPDLYELVDGKIRRADR